MNILKYGGISLVSLFSLILIVCAVRTHRTFKTLVLNALSGICVLAIIDLTSRFTGVCIPINGWTAAGSAIFGIPAVCGFVILPVIFKQ